MDRDTYIAATAPLREHPQTAKIIVAANKIITYSIYVAYPCLLIWIFVTQNGFKDPISALTSIALIKAFFVPMISFVLLSLVRKKINALRPYEVFEMPPIIPKNTHGKSFPSRHVFSIFTIAVTFLACAGSPVFGIVILIMGVLLALLRVMAGVHFPQDVIAGAIIGILCGCIEFLF